MEFYNKLFSTTLIVVLLAFTMNAQETKSKTIDKSFTISNGSTVKIDNSFGAIDVKTSSTNKVEFKIIVQSKSKSADKSQKIIDAITVEFDSNGSTTSAKTVFDDKKLKSAKGKGISYQINYEVMMPKGANLKVTNDFGDVSVANLDSEADIDLSYGKLFMLGVGGDLTLQLDFSNESSVNKAKDVSINMSYSDISFDSADEIKSKAGFSHLNGDNINTVDLSGSYNGLEIDEVQSLEIKGDHNVINIDNLNSADLDGSYISGEIDALASKLESEGDFVTISIDNVAASFDKISLEGDYVNYEIDLGSAANYSIDVAGSHVDFSLPDGIKFSNKKKDMLSSSFEGKKGNGNGGKIYARIDFGGLHID